MNELNKISKFNSCMDTNPASEMTVKHFCLNIINGRFAEDITKLRTISDKQQRDDIKKTLPAVTPSGTFSQRNNVSLIKHSGFMCVDVDAKHNPTIKDWEAFRNSLAGYDYTYFVALSASGKGVFILIPIAYPHRHGQTFDALKQDFADIGITIDIICRGVSWLRIVSYDPDAVLNPDAKVYDRYIVPPPPPKPTESNGSALVYLLKKIIRSQTDITSNYFDWLEIGRALHNELGATNGRAWFHSISQFYGDYSKEKADRQFNAIEKSPGRATEATIYEIAKQHNIYLKN